MSAEKELKRVEDAPTDEDADKQVEMWKVRRLIQTLEAARGNGTSMISLVIPPKDQISRISKMLTEEIGTATNIKSRVNRLSVLTAITSAQQRLKLYNRVPDNGLVLYCGTVVTAEGKEKKISIDFEPFKPINTSLYLCDNKFHIEALNELLESDEKFGFIIMDGNGALFGVLSGNTRTILHKFSVDLPKKHGRGGQSALRFARLRLEKRHNYLRKVAETATAMFISNDRPNVSGLVLAGSAEFKSKLSTSDLFDPRLSAVVAKIVDVSYGGENGFNQAIELAQDCLANVKFIREKKILSTYFAEISKDSGKYCFGVNDTLAALDLGSVEDLIVWDSLPIQRYTLKNKVTGVETVKYLNEKQEGEGGRQFESEGDSSSSSGSDSSSSSSGSSSSSSSSGSGSSTDSSVAGAGGELEVVNQVSLLEWLTQNYKRFGARLVFVTNKSQEGSQFCRGFGGIGGLLRYQVDFLSMDAPELDDDEDEDGDSFI